MVTDADVIVVGLGLGGEYIAGRLAEAGLDAVGIESALVGGECPYWGCVPSKMVIRAANALAEARRVSGLAGHADVRPDWSFVPGVYGKRRPTTGTTRLPSSVSRARAAGSCVAARP